MRFFLYGFAPDPKTPRRAAFVTALLLALLPAPARADDAAEASLHFQLGANEFRARHFAEALTHFLAANRLAPTASTAFNIAQTYLVLDRLPEAYRFFSDYAVNPAATPANRALALRTLERLEPQLARVEVTTSPPGAAIFLDRVDLGNLGVSPRRLAVAPGHHEVIVRQSGYREARASIEAVQGQLAPVALDLVRVIGSLRVATTPPGAAVSVDGTIAAGVTPLAVSLPAGVHHVRIRRDGYVDLTRDVELRGDDAAVLDERLARDLARASVLSVLSSPAGARVTLRGLGLGATPLTTDVGTGSAEVLVEREGFTPWRRSVLLRPGRETNVQVALGRPDASRPVWVPLATITGAAAAAAGIAVGILALLSHSDFNQSPDRATLDRTTTLNLAADVTAGAGIGLLVTGILGYLLVPSPSVSRATVREEGIRGER